MLSLALMSLLIPAAGVADAAVTPVLPQQSSLPVRVWLNKRDAQLGDRVRAYASTQADGYLLVLHAEPDGRIRVLFPVDPVEDNFVRGDEEIEIRGRGNREAFRVYASSGVGTVYAAYSRDPFVFNEFARADHWDYSLPDTWYVTDDPEAELTEIAVAMASGAYFDYDIAQYGVGEAVAYAPGGMSLSFYAGTYFGAGFGMFYNPAYYGWYGWGYPYSWGYPYYWGYYPYRWSRAYYWGYPYYWDYPYYYWGYPYYGGYPYYYGYYYSPYGYYGSHYVSHYYGTSWRGGGYAQPRLRYTSRLSPSNAQSRSRRVYAAGQTTSSARRLGASGNLVPATRGAASSARRLTPTSSAAASADRRSSPVTRNTATTSRRNFPQPVRSTPARRVTDAPEVTARPTTAGSGQATARRVTPTRAPSTATTQRVTPTRPTTSGAAVARPVRPTTSRSQATSTRRTPQTTQLRSTTPRVTARPSTPTSSRSSIRPTTVPRRSVTVTPSRPRMSTPSRAPARVTAPRVVRPSAPAARTPTRPAARSSGSSGRRRP
jgi:hypothetical protein